MNNGRPTMNANDLKDMFMGRKEERTIPVAVEDGALVIGCDGCADPPNPSCERCIGCIVRNLSACGPAERVVLRNGNDLEISGRSGGSLSAAASVMRWASPEKPKGRGCEGCAASPVKVFARAWEDFPAESITYAREMLEWRNAGAGDCESCIARSRRMLDSVESEIKEIVARMVQS